MAELHDADRWIAISDGPLPTEEVSAWAQLPHCGAVVSFIGAVRNHAEGRNDVSALHYEVYEQPALERMAAIAAEARVRWPAIGRIGLLHRFGMLEVGDAAVIVVVSTPHRAEAFDAAEWAIDTIKSAVPIWKKESWASGSDWGHGAVPLASPTAVGGA